MGTEVRQKNKSKMSPNDFVRLFVPAGLDIEAFINSGLWPKKNKKGKINGFYFFLELRKHQLEGIDDVVKDKNQFLSKIDSEWRALTTHEKDRFKSIARGEEPHPGMMPPNQILQDIREDPLAEEEAVEEAKFQAEEAKIEEVEKNLKMVASIAPTKEAKIEKVEKNLKKEALEVASIVLAKEAKIEKVDNNNKKVALEVASIAPAEEAKIEKVENNLEKVASIAPAKEAKIEKVDNNINKVALEVASIAQAEEAKIEKVENNLKKVALEATSVALQGLSQETEQFHKKIVDLKQALDRLILVF